MLSNSASFLEKELIISRVLDSPNYYGYGLLYCCRYDKNGKLYIGFNYIIISLENGVVETVCGNATKNNNGDNGLAINAQIGAIRGIDFDISGNIIFSDYDYSVIRKIDIVTNIITTISSINTPNDLLIDSNNNIYIPSERGHVINKIDNNGNISIIAGTGSAGFSGDGGIALNSSINSPYQISIFSNKLYFIDRDNLRVRQINLDTGIIDTFAGNGNNNYDGDNGLAINAGLYRSRGIATDLYGNVYITNERVIRKVDVNGIITKIAGNANAVGYTGDGGSPLNATFKQTYYLTFDLFHNLVIVDIGFRMIRKINYGDFI